MSERDETQGEWMAAYPGSWKGPRSRRDPCLVCGEPGYLVPAPTDMPVLTEADTEVLSEPKIETAATCPGHEWVVRRHLAERFAPRRMAYREGRP